MKWLIAVAGSIFFSGCTSVPLKPEEQTVKVVFHQDAPAGCKELGVVSSYLDETSGLNGWVGTGDPRQFHLEGLKRATFKKGGNLAVVTKEHPHNKEEGIHADALDGVAYRCDEK
jgi:hypothetical protein